MLQKFPWNYYITNGKVQILTKSHYFTPAVAKTRRRIAPRTAYAITGAMIELDAKTTLKTMENAKYLQPRTCVNAKFALRYGDSV